MAIARSHQKLGNTDNIMRTLQLLTLIGLTFFGLLLNSAYAKIELSLDRNDIRVNETFQLTLHVEDPKTLSAQQPLDFLPSEFQVLGSEHFRKSTVIDRQFANRMGWTITLVSTEAGTFSIPSFNIGNEQSEAMTIRVLPALTNLEEINPNSKIKLTARLSEEAVYVQQQIIYSVRIYSSVASRRHNLSPLQVENAIVKKLGEASEFQLLHEGVRYNVKEEKYVIFPQKSGELNIPPITFRTNIVDAQASFGSLSRYRPIELKSQPFTVQVNPKPENAPAPWIPAKNIELSAKWQADSEPFEVGKPATLDFYIKGVALLPEQLPTIEFPEVDGLKIYRDKPVMQNIINANGVNSYHLEKLAVIPNAAGEVTIPAIKIPYWNTTTNQEAFAELEPITINVNAQANSVALPSINQVTPAVTQPANLEPQAKQNPLWQILTWVFAALWLITSLLFIFRRPKTVSNYQEKNTQTDATTQQQTSLSFKQAANTNDPQVFSQAAIDWVNQRSKFNVTNLNQLVQGCPDPVLAIELQKLQAALYAKDQAASSNWDGSKIYQLLSQVQFSGRNSTSKEQLPPLYPQ